jgi:hypothetical protein
MAHVLTLNMKEQMKKKDSRKKRMWGSMMLVVNGLGTAAI